MTIGGRNGKVADYADSVVPVKPEKGKKIRPNLNFELEGTARYTGLILAPFFALRAVVTSVIFSSNLINFKNNKKKYYKKKSKN